MTFKSTLVTGVAFSVLAISAWAGPSLAATPAAAADAADSGTKLDEVIVTATKSETNLQTTPIAVSVIGGTALAERHAESLISLQDGTIPSLRIATFEARQSALTIGIRGIVPFDANQTARDQGVGVYIDGVYLGRQQGLNAALFDVERIEVLRGPQGTLFGRNAEGGALSIVTKAPTGAFGGRAVAGYGNFGAYNGEIHQNFAQFANLSIKLDGLIQHQDPTVKNPLAGQAGWNQYDRIGGRATVLWQPTDRFSAQISGDYLNDDNTPFFSQLVSFNPYGKRVRSLAELQAGPAAAPSGTINPLSPLVHVYTNRQTVSDIGTIQQPSNDKTGGVSALLKFKISPHLELRSITAVRAVGTSQWDNSGIESRNVFAPNANFGRYSLSDLSQRQFSQELQAVGSVGNTLTYVLGAYYFTEKVKESAATPFTNQFNADGTAFTIRSATGTSPLAASTAGWIRGTRFLSRASSAEAASYAAFGQATYTPAGLDTLHLTVGGRVTDDTRAGTLSIVNGAATNFTFNYDRTRFDPLVTLAYQPLDHLSVYAKYSTGYRAGGANDRSATFQAFGPEDVTAYEIGAKADLLDQRLRVNLAGYLMDRANAQIDFDNVDTTPGSPTQGAHTEETRNAAGTAKIRGFEADVTAKVFQGLTVGASYAYTYEKIPDAPFPFPGNSAVPIGSPFPVHVVYTPTNAASAYVDYEFPVQEMSLRTHFDINYADPQYSFQTEFADVSPTGKLVQNVAVQTGSSLIVNGSVTLADIHFSGSGVSASLSAWSRNLLDESHIYRVSAANRGTIGDYANYNQPRTFGVELRIKY